MSVRSLLVAALAATASALNVPQNARRIHVYKMGTLIEGYGLESEPGHLVVDPVLATLEEGAPLWQKHMDCCNKNKPADAAPDEGREEAARKLVNNHAKVLRDITNGMPRSQLYLERLAMDEAPFADQALREVSRRLLGCPAELAEERVATVDQARAWIKTIAYLNRRIQAAHVECPGRAPDMSEPAAAAMRVALAEVEGAARAAVA